MSYVLESVNNMDLFTVDCPTHGVVPVGFYHQLPRVLNKEEKTVTVTLECSHRGCDYKTERVLKCIEKKDRVDELQQEFNGLIGKTIKGVKVEKSGEVVIYCSDDTQFGLSTNMSVGKSFISVTELEPPLVTNVQGGEPV